MKLEEVTHGASLEGVEPSIVVTVVAAITIPLDSLQLVYRLPDGALRERLLARADEASLVVATASRPSGIRSTLSRGGTCRRSTSRSRRRSGAGGNS